MPKIVQLQNVEKMAEVHEELREPIARWLKNEVIKEDRDVMIDIIEHTLPDDKILWPPWVMFNLDDGHITLSAYVMDITAQA